MHARLAVGLFALAMAGCALNRVPMPPRHGEEPTPPRRAADRRPPAPAPPPKAPPALSLAEPAPGPSVAEAAPPPLDTAVTLASASGPVAPVAAAEPADDAPDSMAALAQDPGQPAVMIAAVVGRSVITLRELKLAVRERAKAGASWDQMPREAKNQLARETLEYLIDRSLLVQAARADMKDDKKWQAIRDGILKMWVEDELPGLVRREGVADEVQLVAKLEKGGETLADRREEFMAETIAKMYAGQKIRAKIARLGEQEVYGYYLENLGAFRQSAEVTWREIFIPTDAELDRETARKLIEAARSRVGSGEDFARVAAEVSRGAHAAQGGLWVTGYDSFNSAPVREALKRLRAGQVSEILAGSDGFYLVKVESHRPAGTRPLGEVQSTIEHALMDRHTKEALDELMRDLQRRFPVSSPSFAGTESEPRQARATREPAR